MDTTTLSIIFYIIVFVGAMYGLYYSLTHKPPKTISEALPKDFKTSVIIGNIYGVSIAFDDKGKQFCFGVGGSAALGYQILGTHNYTDVKDYEILENGHAVQGGGLGGAVAGGLLFGGVGAVTGAVVGKKTTGYNVIMQVRIKTKSEENPIVNIQWQYDGSAVNPQALQYVYQLANKLDDILGRKKEEPAPAHVVVAAPAPTPPPADSTEELRKYKQLLDDGVITQDDFDAKKRQILGV